jgi:hypothetical protein
MEVADLSRKSDGTSHGLVFVHPTRNTSNLIVNNLSHLVLGPIGGGGGNFESYQTSEFIYYCLNGKTGI